MCCCLGQSGEIVSAESVSCVVVWDRVSRLYLRSLSVVLLFGTECRDCICGVCQLSCCLGQSVEIVSGGVCQLCCCLGQSVEIVSAESVSCVVVWDRVSRLYLRSLSVELLFGTECRDCICGVCQLCCCLGQSGEIVSGGVCQLCCCLGQSGEIVSGGVCQLCCCLGQSVEIVSAESVSCVVVWDRVLRLYLRSLSFELLFGTECRDCICGVCQLSCCLGQSVEIVSAESVSCVVVWDRVLRLYLRSLSVVLLFGTEC